MSDNFTFSGEDFVPITPELKKILGNQLRREYEEIIRKKLELQSAQYAYYKKVMAGLGFDGDMLQYDEDTYRYEFFTFMAFLYSNYGAKIKDGNTISKHSADLIMSQYGELKEEE